MIRDPFRTVHRLALATAVLMFGLIVLGSVVRTTGSGLSCPDWPLCEGRIIPRLQLNVMLEWTHRLVALVVGIGLLATTGWTLARAELRARLGGLAVLALALYVTQALLGALTVWKLLDPGVVGGHLATGLLLFATLLTLTLVARRESARATATAGAEPLPARPAGLLANLGAVTALTYGQCVMGGIVSTHGAGLACAGWPTCNGEWFPPFEGLVALQMTHRTLAYLLAAAMLVTALRLRVAPDAALRAGAPVALGLTIAQVVLGVSNVFLGTPPWLSALHLATATTILAVMVMLTHRAATLPATRPALVMAAAR